MKRSISLVIEGSGGILLVRRPDDDESLPGVWGLPAASLRAGESEREPPEAQLVASDPYNIIYSSGTTGEPKGIVHTHEVRAGYCTLFASAFRMTASVRSRDAASGSNAFTRM